MQILVPFKEQASIESFLNAGAQEFYMGFHDEKFTSQFGKYTDINRMTGFGNKANPFNFKECLNHIHSVRSNGGKAFVTLNANSYSEKVITYIQREYLPELKKYDISGIITSSIHLAKVIRGFDIPIVASTMCGIYNSDIAKVYYKNGFHRIIVPRDLSLNEINEIINELPQATFEVFFMRNGCIFSDCYCLGLHHKNCGATCHFIRSHSKRFITFEDSFEKRQNIDLNNKLYDDIFHKETCGLCALYRLMNFGVNSLKIVGRSDNPQAILDDIKLINNNIQIAQSSNSEEEYLKFMEFPSNRSSKCISGLSCYYPEVRFS